jgi:hypothetical protein
VKVVRSAVIDVDATKEAVWDTLTDFPAYPEWSTFSRAEGVARVGARLTMRLPHLTIRPVVTVAVPGEELCWAGTLVAERVFRGWHSFTLSTNPDGSTRLTNREDFSGALVTLARPFLKASDDGAYAAFNARLKQRVEGRR